MDVSLRVIAGVLATRGDLVLGYVFGSLARGEDRPESDADVAVLGAHELGATDLGSLCSELERALGRPVDVVDLMTAPPLLAFEVVRDGVRVLVRDQERRMDFEMDAVRRMEDTRRLRAVQQELLRERARAA